MWRVKTDAKFENSFFPVLIYWSDNRIHLGTIKKWTFVLLVYHGRLYHMVVDRAFP